MKRFLITLLLTLCPLLAIAQQTQAPAPIPLNAEASKTFVEIETAQAELRRRYGELESAKSFLRVGAGVPDDFVCEQSDGAIVCAKPKPSASPSPKP